MLWMEARFVSLSLLNGTLEPRVQEVSERETKRNAINWGNKQFYANKAMAPRFECLLRLLVWQPQMRHRKEVKRAANTLTALTESGHRIPDGEFTHADCVAVIPGFKRVAAVVGVGHGRGFISCRNGDDWSAPGAITLDSGNLGVEIGGEDIDIVVISLDPEKRSKLLSDGFAVESDASAAWGNGKSAQDAMQIRRFVFTAALKAYSPALGRIRCGSFRAFAIDGRLSADFSRYRACHPGWRIAL